MEERLKERFNVYWKELAPREHLLHLYEDDSVLLETLTGFVGGGLRGSDAVVIIATRAHLDALEDRLKVSGVELENARAENRYVPFDAEETLAKFMLGRWPDEALFVEFVGDVMDRVRGDGRRVRAFGEMVAILWAQGNKGATLVLEQLWHRICAKSGLSLLCAYPHLSVLEEEAPGQSDIRALHTQVVD
jgi:hypothetical protein